MAVVAAGEFDDLVPAGVAAGQTDGAHGGLGAGADHAHHFHGGDRIDDHVAPGSSPARSARRKLAAALHGFLDSFNHVGVAMADDHRPPGADVVHKEFPSSS